MYLFQGVVASHRPRNHGRLLPGPRSVEAKEFSCTRRSLLYREQNQVSAGVESANVRRETYHTTHSLYGELWSALVHEGYMCGDKLARRKLSAETGDYLEIWGVLNIYDTESMRTVTYRYCGTQDGGGDAGGRQTEWSKCRKSGIATEEWGFNGRTPEL